MPARRTCRSRSETSDPGWVGCQTGCVVKVPCCQGLWWAGLQRRCLQADIQGMHRSIARLVIAGLLTVGCTSSSTGDYQQTLVDGRVEVDAVSAFVPGFACGAALVPSGSPIPEPQPLDDDAREALEALRAKVSEGERFVADYEYGIHSRTGDELILLGTSLDGSLSDARLRHTHGQWETVGWGTCWWRPDGFDLVKWQVDPDYDLDPESQTIEILAVDNCGTVLDKGYQVVVAANLSSESITIEIWQALHPPPGSESGFSELACRLGGIVPLTVHLAEPIGTRTISGAYAYPDGPINQ